MLKILLLFSTLMLLGPSRQEPAAPPPVPADAAATVNPVKPTAASLAHAKKMYGYDCMMCHGQNGDGKGELAVSAKMPLKDWTSSASLKDMTDGQLFYIIKNGRGQMPAEGDRVNSDGLWNMVVLVRSFAKQ
jgi:mono/diheme cytochrome c family protein